MTTLSILAIIALLSVIVGMKEGSAAGVVMLFVSLAVWLIGFMVYDTTFDQEAIAERKAQEVKAAAQRQANETPHVIREADGCKVYAFLSGDRYHYFTRCPDARTVTESSWDECHTEMVGKISTRKCVAKAESIGVTQ